MCHWIDISVEFIGNILLICAILIECTDSVLVAAMTSKKKNCKNL